MSNITTKKTALLVGASLLSITASNAALLRVTIEAPSNLGLAPALISFHDGSNNFFDVGSAASPGLETLAEVGDTGGLQASLTTGDNITIVNGGPTGPGSSNSAVIDVSSGNTFLSFAAMLLPSNDWFIGNDANLDITSVLNGPLGTSMSFDFSTVYDAGTEEEDFAFSAGNPLIGLSGGDAGAGTEQGENISEVSGADPFAAFQNADSGFTSADFDFIANSSILGRVTIEAVPEPSTALLSSLAGLGLLVRRRR